MSAAPQPQRATAPAVLGVNHVALTVRNLDVSGPWYTALLGQEPDLDERSGAGFRHLVWVFDDGTAFGIHQHDRTTPDEVFSELHVGLDHAGFGCADRRHLDAWVSRLDDLGISHAGVVDAYYGSVLSFRDPDGIALEVFAPPTGSSD